MGAKINFFRRKIGVVTVELQAKEVEKVINILWRKGINISNVRKNSINVMVFDVNYDDYEAMTKILERTKCTLKIINTRGFVLLSMKLKKRIAMALGVFVFIGIIIALSNFIWGIDITTEKNIAPYEIREELKNIGIVPGISKNKINVYHIEAALVNNNYNIMWARARIIGSKLKITVAERQSPPEVINDNTPCNLIAKKDGEIVRVYTKAGTAVVKQGDIVRKGQLIVKGEQGKEGTVYAVHASGDVIARTYSEEVREVPLTKVNRNRTGNKMTNYYIVVFGKKIYLKNSLNKFTKYDKIENDSSIIKKDVYYEVKEKSIKLDPKKVEKNTGASIYNNLISNFDKSVKVIDKVIENSEENNMCKVRVMVITEENIAEVQK